MCVFFSTDMPRIVGETRQENRSIVFSKENKITPLESVEIVLVLDDFVPLPQKIEI